VSVIVKPIPLSVLVHTVEYEQFQEGDGITTEDGYKLAVTFYNVRVQVLSTIKKNTNSEELLYDALLFFDVVNSSSSGPFVFTEKSKITFNSKAMTIEKVNPVEAFALHHYEIGLV
jgi:Minor capsid protein